MRALVEWEELDELQEVLNKDVQLTRYAATSSSSTSVQGNFLTVNLTVSSAPQVVVCSFGASS